MRGVEDMRLRDSALTGPVPMEWATELTQLQFIDLGASLTGALPVEWIANCRRLKLLCVLPLRLRILSDIAQFLIMAAESTRSFGAVKGFMFRGERGG
jgi:hypothetical protein